MADNEPVDAEAIAALRKKRQFKKFQYRGMELDKLMDLSHTELLDFVTARARRRMQRGLKRKPMALIKKLRKAKLCKFISLPFNLFCKNLFSHLFFMYRHVQLAAPLTSPRPSRPTSATWLSSPR